MTGILKVSVFSGRAAVAWSVLGVFSGVFLVCMVNREVADLLPGVATLPGSEEALLVVVDDEELVLLDGSGMATPAGFPGRLLLLEAVARENDPDVLVAGIHTAITKSPSIGRDFELETLLTRVMELHPERALRVIQTVEIPTGVAKSVFRSLARGSSQVAVALIRAAHDPRTWMQLALAIVDVADEAAIERIVSEVPHLSVDGLRLAVLLQIAQRNPVSAMREVEKLDSLEARAHATLLIGGAAGMHDPESGVLLADAISSPNLRAAYLTEVYKQWSLRDVPALLHHLGLHAHDHRVLEFLPQSVWAVAAESDPVLLLEFGQAVGGELGMAAESAALEVLAASDPTSVVGYLVSLRHGYRRDMLTTSIATGYARHDPEAAFTWVENLSPPNTQARQAVLLGLAATDFERAVLIELDRPANPLAGVLVGGSAIPEWFASRILDGLESPDSIADSLVAAGLDRREERMLSMVLSRWAETDADGVVHWMLNNRGNIPVDALSVVAEQLSSDHVEDKLRLVELVEPGRQPAWIRNVISRMAISDSAGAMAIAERYRDAPYHESLLTDIALQVMTHHGPEAAAGLVGYDPPQGATLMIAGQWARTDPAAAAGWVAGLTEQDLKERARSEICLREPIEVYCD